MDPRDGKMKKFFFFFSIFAGLFFFFFFFPCSFTATTTPRHADYSLL